MRYILKILVLIFCLFSSSAFAEMEQYMKFVLNDGTILYPYKASDIPKEIRQDKCEMYVFTDKNFTSLKNGRYILSYHKDIPIMIIDSCFFSYITGIKLDNGDSIEFYSSTHQSDADGNAAFIISGQKYERVYDKDIKLSNGLKVSVRNGTVDRKSLIETRNEK
ncbi:MAG: hypothetical protein R3D71_04735 [Rickettsiales bacterium]